MNGQNYRFRAIEQTFATRAAHKVAILEGRRAVGKTSLVRHLVDEGLYASYQSLADPATLARASASPDRWLASLEFPAVVDEAQLLPGISLAAKELIDAMGPGHHLLLTGSASVGRGTMAGSDPLVGRATRVQLQPFSAFELSSQTRHVPSLVDLLFEADLQPVELSSVNQDQLIRMVRLGGIPANVLSAVAPSRNVLEARIQSDTLAILGDQVLPNERLDIGLADIILSSILRIPGGQLNQTRIAQELSLDQRTIARYLGILQRRFLVTTLPNLRAGAARAGRSMPKAHAVDSASSCAALSNCGRDVASSPESLGQVLETWVVQQIEAASGWADRSAQLFYWRDNKSGQEVDLVIVDDLGRRVGVEVKLASSISPADLRGLRAMRAHNDMYRGYIVYPGSRIELLDEDIWALPVSALHDPRLWPTSTTTQEKREVIMLEDPMHPLNPTPSVFLSYVHEDDNYFNGMLVEFARQVVEACKMELGVSVELIVDRDALGWGEQWQKRLQQEVGRATFLLAMVTPRYVRSEACQDEFMQFRTRSAAESYQGILTLLVKNPRWDKSDIAANDTCRIIKETVDAHHWLKPEVEFEELEPGNREFRMAAKTLGKALAERIEKFESSHPDTRSQHETADQQQDGLVELMERLNDTEFPRLQHEIERFHATFTSFSEVFTDHINRIPGQPQTATMARIAHAVDPARKELDGAAVGLKDAWSTVDTTLNQLIQLADHAGLPVQDLLENLASVADGLDDGQMQQMTTGIRQLAALSRMMRPTAQTLERALSVISSVKRSGETWHSTIRSR